MYTIDEKFMKKALIEAKKAFEADEVPIGAVVVKDGKIIARAFNNREASHDPTGHAEIIALRKAAKKLQSWRLENTTLYVTIEPCSMCAGASVWARVGRIVYGAKEPKGGALGSSYHLYEQKNLNHYPDVTSGVLEAECSQLISLYFKTKRMQKKAE
jgi:tRNA(adenine34) deaminase